MREIIEIASYVKYLPGVWDRGAKTQGGGAGAMYAPVPEMNTPVGNHSKSNFKAWQRLIKLSWCPLVYSRLICKCTCAVLLNECCILDLVVVHLRTAFDRAIQMCFGLINHEWRHFRDSQPVVLCQSSSDIGYPHTNCNLRPVLSHPSLANKRNVRGLH